MRLPCGDRLTAQRLQFLGMSFGHTGGYDNLHYLLEEAWIGGGRLSDTFLSGVEDGTALTANPLFAVLHEAAYCQGRAANWAAARVHSEFPAFAIDNGRINLTGEMIYPWMFESYGSLRPLRETADHLARRIDWPPLYDLDTLAANQVPVAAAIYFDDLYVAREFSLETARRIRGTRSWITNEFEHDALRKHGELVFDRLLHLTYAC